MKKITVICHNFSTDLRSGYGYAFGLYHILSQIADIKVIIPRDSIIYKEDSQSIGINMMSKVITPNEKFESSKNQWDYYNKYIQSESLKEKLYQEANNADLIICEGSYFVSFARSVFPDKKIIYRCLDVEYDKTIYFFKYHNKYLYNNNEDSILQSELQSVYDFEKKACENADSILALTSNDIKRLHELYEISEHKFHILPLCEKNAEIMDGYIPINNQKAKVKNALIINNVPLENADVLMAVVQNLPEITFHILGKCGYYLESYPENVKIYGRVSELQKRKIIRECDFAINISHMTFGINVKVLDYFKMGIPVLTNQLGTKGYEIKANIHYSPIEISTLESDIRRFCELDVESRNLLVRNAFVYLCEKHNYNDYLYLFNDYLKIEKKDKQYFIFGAGILGEQAIKELNMNGYKCLGFADNDKSRHNSFYCGKEIFSPDYVFEKICKNPEKYSLVISVGYKYFSEVLTQVTQKVSLENIFVFDAYSTANIISIERYALDKIIKSK